MGLGGPTQPHLQSLHKLEAEFKRGTRVAQKEAISVREQTSALSSEEITARSSCCLRPDLTDLHKPAKEKPVTGKVRYFIFIQFFNLPSGEQRGTQVGSDPGR